MKNVASMAEESSRHMIMIVFVYFSCFRYLHGDYVVKSSAIIGPETGDLLGPDWTYRGY